MSVRRQAVVLLIAMLLFMPIVVTAISNDFAEDGILVNLTASELEYLCNICQDCPLCKRLNSAFDPEEALHGRNKFEIHLVDTDPNPVNRWKRIVDLTKPAKYHCGKCPTCYCYYRSWRG